MSFDLCHLAFKNTTAKFANSLTNRQCIRRISLYEIIKRHEKKHFYSTIIVCTCQMLADGSHYARKWKVTIFSIMLCYNLVNFSNVAFSKNNCSVRAAEVRALGIIISYRPETSDIRQKITPRYEILRGRSPRNISFRGVIFCGIPQVKGQ